MLKRDVENLSSGDFDDKYIRHAFISKVFSIIGAQLLITLGIVAIFVYVDAVHDFVTEHSWLLWVAVATTLVIMIPIICCEGVRRSYPINIILLIIFTLAESFLVGCLAMVLPSDVVLMAIGITTIIVLVLTIFALQTSIDFTTCWAFFFVAGALLIIIGIVAWVMPSRTLIIVYCSLAILFLSMMLVFNIQLLMGGKHKYSISPEDYIFAALNIYVDIIGILMFVLRLLGMNN